MRRLNDEDGATLVIVVILMALLLGMAAFVIDVSALYQERRELQNGADAAALAVADDCARGETCTIATGEVTALEYAGGNADDEVSDATIDPDDFDPDGRVTVHTSTRTAGGSTLISFIFEPVLDLFGGADPDGETVTASATAIWTSPTSLRHIPLTVSYCEWDRETSTGSDRAVADPLFDPADEVTLSFHDGGSDETCGAVAGMDSDGDGKLPAGFGWLLDDGDCEVVTETIGESDWVVQDPGADTECAAGTLDDLVGSTVGLPIFIDFCMNNDDGCPSWVRGDKYELWDYAAFYITGYDLGGPSWEQSDGVYRTAPPDCGTSANDDHCLTGFFTTAVLDGGGSGGHGGGVITIKLID